MVKRGVLLPGWVRESRIETSMNHFEIRWFWRHFKLFRWNCGNWIVETFLWIFDEPNHLYFQEEAKTPNGFPNTGCFYWNSSSPQYCCIAMPFRLKVLERSIASNWIRQLLSPGWFSSCMACGLLRNCFKPVRLHVFLQFGSSIHWNVHCACAIRSTFGSEFNSLTEELSLFQLSAASSLWIQHRHLVIKSSLH